MSEEIPYNCLKCGLYKGCHSPFMAPETTPAIDDGAAADIMIIGESPGKEEDREGVPFVGRSGKLLRDILEDTGLKHYETVITNACICRPKDNKAPTNKQIDLCAELYLQPDIEEYDPRLIILLGNIPLKAVLGESGITNWRGVVVEREDRIYLPTFHPAYVLRNTNAMTDVLDDFDKVHDLLDGTLHTDSAFDDYEMIAVGHADEAQAMYNDIRAVGRCSFDIEATSVKVFDKDQEIIAVSLAIDNPKTVWVVFDDFEEVTKILANPEIEKIAHNAKFDAQASYMLLDIWVENIVGDSMLLSYVLDSQPGRHGLKVLAGRYLGMYDYSKELDDYLLDHKEADPSKGGDFGLVPMEIIIPYTARDAAATLELHKLLYAKLTDKQKILYNQLLMQASESVAQMEINGVPLDEDVVEDYVHIYRTERVLQYVDMVDDSVVQRYIDNRHKQGQVKRNKEGEVVWKSEFNPNSAVQMRELLFGKKYFGLKPVGNTASGLPSTKWDFIKVYKDDLDFLGNYRYYKLLEKMLNTYLQPALGWRSTGDNRVRSSYFIHGTVTGRLSSRRPNLQNIPTPEKEPGTLLEREPIKNIFTHTHPDGCIMAVDYAGMELRTMASLSQCGNMLDAFERDEDVHSYVTSMLYGVARKDYNDNDWKAMRYRAKWVNWTLLYGGGWHTLNRIYGIPEDEAQNIVSKYYAEFPEILEFVDYTLEFTRKHGYAESPFGRRRYFPYIDDRDGSRRAKAEREAVNMPVQSAAGDILLCALVIIDNLMAEEGFESMLINTVHDSLMFDIWPGEMDDVAELCIDVMENIKEWGPQWFPGLDFEWFTSPLKADVEFGSHYGSLKHWRR